jgi:hypothetical protein
MRENRTVFTHFKMQGADRNLYLQRASNGRRKPYWLRYHQKVPRMAPLFLLFNGLMPISD